MIKIIIIIILPYNRNAPYKPTYVSQSTTLKSFFHSTLGDYKQPPRGRLIEERLLLCAISTSNTLYHAHTTFTLGNWRSFLPKEPMTSLHMPVPGLEPPTFETHQTAGRTREGSYSPTSTEDSHVTFRTQKGSNFTPWTLSILIVRLR